MPKDFQLSQVPYLFEKLVFKSRHRPFNLGPERQKRKKIIQQRFKFRSTQKSAFLLFRQLLLLIFLVIGAKCGLCIVEANKWWAVHTGAGWNDNLTFNKYWQKCLTWTLKNCLKKMKNHKTKKCLLLFTFWCLSADRKIVQSRKDDEITKVVFLNFSWVKPCKTTIWTRPLRKNRMKILFKEKRKNSGN